MPVVYAADDRMSNRRLPSPSTRSRKATRGLRRVRNIRERPEVALIVDDYRRIGGGWPGCWCAGPAIEPASWARCGACRAAAKVPAIRRMRLEALPVIVIQELPTRSWRGGATTDAPERERLGGKSSPRSSAADARFAPSTPGPCREPSRGGDRGGGMGAITTRPPALAIRRRRVSGATGRTRGRHGGDVAGTAAARRSGPGDRRGATGEESRPTAPRSSPDRHLSLLAGLDVYPDPERQRRRRRWPCRVWARRCKICCSRSTRPVSTGAGCAPRFSAPRGADVLGLDEALIPHAMIAVGYAASDPVRRPRLPLDELIVDWQ